MELSLQSLTRIQAMLGGWASRTHVHFFPCLPAVLLVACVHVRYRGLFECGYIRSAVCGSDTFLRSGAAFDGFRACLPSPRQPPPTYLCRRSVSLVVGYVGVLVGLFHKILFGGSVSRQKASVNVSHWTAMPTIQCVITFVDRGVSRAGEGGGLQMHADCC